MAAVAAVDAALPAGPPYDTSAWRVSVIIPVLNEAKAIEATIRALQQLQPPVHEIVVVDGGSTDSTVRLARRAGALVVTPGRRGRAVQMNAGARAASGELLCFLHADSTPPPDLVAVLRRELAEPRTVLMGFVTSIEVPGQKLHFLTAHHYLKTYYTPLLLRPFSFARGLRCLLGDQTLCARAAEMRRVGGFDESLLLMEDADLCMRLHEAGPDPRWAVASAGSSARPPPGVCARSGGGSGDGGGGGVPLPPPWWAALPWRPRGRVRHVHTTVPAVTSGRRLAAWGNVYSTYIHVVIGFSWFMTRDPQLVTYLYHRLYTDAYR